MKNIVHVYPKQEEQEHSLESEFPCDCGAIVEDGIVIHQRRDEKYTVEDCTTRREQ